MTITIRTFTGIEVPMLAPKASHIAVADIARGLSLTARFNGQCNHFYSVAEHSVLVASLLRAWRMDEDVVRAGLLHDAQEAYIGDATSPLKRALRAIDGREVSAFDALEMRWESVIAERFGLTQQKHEAVKRADIELLSIEDHEVRGLESLVTRPLVQVRCLSPGAAEGFFLSACAQWGIR